jgi:hypothetical protein
MAAKLSDMATGFRPEISCPALTYSGKTGMKYVTIYKVMPVSFHVCNNMYIVQHLACKIGDHNMWVQHLMVDVWRR